ncbi:MAG: guanylate kinase [Deltaproteobacteria bacterium]|nr:guanylate kinase [Deltaproteobacteria bacterium]
MSNEPPPPRSEGVLLVISAASGAGKTTLARRLLGDDPRAAFSVSYTTRARRGKEVDGVDYHFVDDAGFDALIAEGALVEWAQVHGHRYGTSHATIREGLAAGKIVIFDIDVQGGEQIAAAYPEALTVWVMAPGAEELERRLRGRGTDAAEQVERRLAVAAEENARGLRCYRFLVVNDRLEEALGDLKALLRAESCRLPR